MSDNLTNYIQNTLRAAPAQIIRDGKIHRFDLVKKGAMHGWYIAFDDKYDTATFGSWLTGEKHTWHSKSQNYLNESDLNELRLKRQDQKKQQEIEIKNMQEKSAKKSNWIWDNATPLAQNHPYLERKNVLNHGLRIWKQFLAIPVFIDNNITSLQLIDQGGKKIFIKESELIGGHFIIGKIDGIVIICEGYATAASLYESTEYACVVCFNAGNIDAVGTYLRRENSEIMIVIAGDDDYKTKVHGKMVNRGKIEAIKAAKSCQGYAVFPPFNRGEGQCGTDWNDYSCLRGQAATKMMFDLLLDQAVD